MKKLERKQMKEVKGGKAPSAWCKTAGQPCKTRLNECCAGLACDACQAGGVNCTCSA